jgi:hypothetical protein
MGKNNPDIKTTHKTMISPTTTNNSFQIVQSADHHLNNFQTIKVSRSVLAKHISESFLLIYSRMDFCILSYAFIRSGENAK